MQWAEIENLTGTFVGDWHRQEQLMLLHHLPDGVIFAEVIRVSGDKEFVLLYRDIDGTLTHFKPIDISRPSGL